MEKEIVEILAAASPEFGKWAAFWLGFWEAAPFILMLLLITWGIRTYWKYYIIEDNEDKDKEKK